MELVRQRDAHAVAGKGLRLFGKVGERKRQKQIDGNAGQYCAKEYDQTLAAAFFAVGERLRRVVVVKPEGVAGGQIKLVFAG